MYDAGCSQSDAEFVIAATDSRDILTMHGVRAGSVAQYSLERVQVSSHDWERTWAMWLHLSTFLATLGLPLMPAWALWMLRRRESALIDDHGRECLNQQLSNLIIGLAGFLLSLCGLGLLLIGAAMVLAAWSAIAGAMAAKQGRLYRSPMTWRLIAPAVIPSALITPTSGVS